MPPSTSRWCNTSKERKTSPLALPPLSASGVFFFAFPKGTAGIDDDDAEP